MISFNFWQKLYVCLYEINQVINNVASFKILIIFLCI